MTYKELCILAKEGKLEEDVKYLFTITEDENEIPKWANGRELLMMVGLEEKYKQRMLWGDKVSDEKK